MLTQGNILLLQAAARARAAKIPGALCEPIGSAVLGTTPPKDVDMLFYVPQCVSIDEAYEKHFSDMQPDGNYDREDGLWGAMRLGDLNLIVTVDLNWYDQALLAQRVCVALNLTDKGDRIVVYRVVRDGLSPEEANACRDGRASPDKKAPVGNPDLFN